MASQLQDFKVQSNDDTVALFVLPQYVAFYRRYKYNEVGNKLRYFNLKFEIFT